MDGNEVKRQLERLLTTGALLWERLLRPRSRFNPAASAPRHVLVLHFPVTVGMAVQELCLLQALKELSPAPQVSVASAGAGLQLLQDSPFADRVIAVPSPVENLWAAAKALKEALAAQSLPVDCVLFGVFDRQRAIVRLAWLATDCWRAGFAEDPRLVQRPLEYDDALGVAQNNVRVAALLGWHGTASPPRMFVSPATLDYARQLLGDDGRPTLTLIPQASAQSSSWVPERMAEVLRHARDVLGFRVFLDGTAAQAATIEGIIAASGGPAVSLAGRTSLRQVAAVCGLSDLVVGVDTGTTHIAKAVGVPTVVLMPSWEQPHNWHALPQPAVALLYKGTGARVASGYAMEDLTVEDVLAAAQRLLASFPPSEEARSVRVARMLHERLPAD